MVLVRFAPSPTGPLHLGGLRMALYNHLFARKNKGKWVLRIEDTDKTRYVPGSVEGIQRALDWAGLNYDYGPGREGPHGPYFQSLRLDLYKTYASKLIEAGHAYRCFCTPDTLADVKEKLARSGASASYDRRCLHLTEEEAARKVRAGEKYTIRFNTTALPSRPPTQDLIFRSLRDAHQSLATDPILLKSDSFPTYHLASIVDDHEMGITHVLRGEEWITSLPLHLDLYAALKLAPPTFAHFPILLNPDGSKMSKRHGDIRVEDFIKRGWEPDAVLNWLLLCGYGVRTQPQHDSATQRSVPQGQQLESNSIMNLHEMVDLFDISNLTQRNTILEAANLHYINKHHLMRKMKNEEELMDLVKAVRPKVVERFPGSTYTTDATIRQAILLLEGRLTNIYDLPDLVPYLFEEPKLDDVMLGFNSPEALKKIASLVRESLTRIKHWDHDLASTLTSLYPDSSSENPVVQKELQELKSLGIKKKDMLRGVRWGITGMKEGPALADTLLLLGRERVMDRLDAIEAWKA